MKRVDKLAGASNSERQFVAKNGQPTENQRLEAYKVVLGSHNCLDDDMGDFESSSWMKKHRRTMYSMAKGSVIDVGTRRAIVAGVAIVFVAPMTPISSGSSRVKS